MKTLITLIALVTFSLTASAQEQKVEVIKNTEVVVLTTIKKETIKVTPAVARVHKNRNYKVIKALKFTGKKNTVMA